ncbi:LPS translocon maturation chaperone LptM [Xenorhabdus mauleonii]|nr:lipoprotein [Xenorhabdus mauleonii]
MKKQLRWSLTIIALLSLAGCGLKGPLYFPPATQSLAGKADMNNTYKALPADTQQSVEVQQ